MAQQSPKQKTIVERVMHEFKTGDLEKTDGAPVKNPQQAIALSEAGSSHRKSPSENRRALRSTEQRKTPQDKREGGTSRDALYAEAQRRDIAGRSKMTKAQLEYALDR